MTGPNDQASRWCATPEVMMRTVDAAPLPQHMEALGRANEVRLARAEIKREISAGRRDVCEVILNPSQAALGMTVEQLLKSLYRFGDHRVSQVIHGVCRGNLTLGKMGDYTRRRLVDAVDEALGRPPRPGLWERRAA